MINLKVKYKLNYTIFKSHCQILCFDQMVIHVEFQSIPVSCLRGSCRGPPCGHIRYATYAYTLCMFGLYYSRYK